LSIFSFDKNDLKLSSNCYIYHKHLVDIGFELKLENVDDTSILNCMNEVVNRNLELKLSNLINDEKLKQLQENLFNFDIFHESLLK
jgi:hypothetical protein